MSRKIFINGKREGYSTEQCQETLTVKELIQFLEENFEEDDELYLRNDNGYTYGSITRHDINNEGEFIKD